MAAKKKKPEGAPTDAARIAALEMNVAGIGDTLKQLVALMNQTPAPIVDPDLSAYEQVMAGKIAEQPPPPEQWRESDERQYRGPIPPAHQPDAVSISTALKPKLLAYVDYVTALEGGHRGEAWTRGDAVAYLVSRAWAADYVFRARGRLSGLRDTFNPTTGAWGR